MVAEEPDLFSPRRTLGLIRPYPARERGGANGHAPLLLQPTGFAVQPNRLPKFSLLLKRAATTAAHRGLSTPVTSRKEETPRCSLSTPQINAIGRYFSPFIPCRPDCQTASLGKSKRRGTGLFYYTWLGRDFRSVTLQSVLICALGTSSSLPLRPL